jgi:DNA-binding IclR family transcriptional regulator
MADVAIATGGAVRLGVLRGVRVAYAQTRPGAAAPSVFSGTLLPAHATALGRALLAFSPADVVDAVVVAGLPSIGTNTPTTPERLRRSLAVTRLTRIAVQYGVPRQEPAAVAMPVFGAGGEVLAALELVVANPRAEMAKARAALIVATASLSRQLATMRVESPAEASDAATG